jgi:hypothetical protein
MWGALLVLVTNVVVIIVTSTLTLRVQRAYRMRRAQRLVAATGGSA